MRYQITSSSPSRAGGAVFSPAWNPMSAPPPAGCVTLDERVYLSVPLLPPPSNGAPKGTFFIGFLCDLEAIFVCLTHTVSVCSVSVTKEVMQ